MKKTYLKMNRMVAAHYGIVPCTQSDSTFFLPTFFASTDCFVTNYTMPLRIANDELHVSCFCAKLVKFEVVAPRLF